MCIVITTSEPSAVCTMQQNASNKTESVSFFSPFGCCACDGARKKKNRLKKTAYAPPARPPAMGFGVGNVGRVRAFLKRARVFVATLGRPLSGLRCRLLRCVHKYNTAPAAENGFFFFFTHIFFYGISFWGARARALYYFFSARPFYSHIYFVFSVYFFQPPCHARFSPSRSSRGSTNAHVIHRCTYTY